VSGYDVLLGIAGRMVGARYPDRREEIVETARAAGGDGSGWTRLAELASLVGLALRPARTSASPRTVWLQGAVLAGTLVVVTLLAPATPFVLAVPFVLLALGLVDARLAAAATIFWLWRLATADLGDVIGALGDASVTAQLVRWVAMLVGIVIAARVTRASIRRAASL
jgi:hypothetical protein